MQLKSHKNFLITFLALLIITSLAYQVNPFAAWLCFTVAAASAIGNDSIQTLGTFISSNSKIPWWILWIFIAGIFCLTILYGYYIEQDVAFGRLNKIPAVTTLTYWQAVAPVILIGLTYCKIPISTTFLILSVFAANKTIEKMLYKSFMGYGVAFTVGVIIFTIFFFIPYFQRNLSAKEERNWRIAQWLVTAFLWSSWLMQDTANIVVFLPRDLSSLSIIAIILIGSSILGLILFYKGGRIQSIVTEKKDINDVRAATFIDLTLAFTLLYFKNLNDIPMSTTWVFLGLLAGRETILTILATIHQRPKLPIYRSTLRLVIKDIFLAIIGILISIGLVALSKL